MKERLGFIAEEASVPPWATHRHIAAHLLALAVILLALSMARDVL